MKDLSDFSKPAYLAGKAAGEKYNADPTQATYDSLPNPYEYGSEDWQLWNIGWNYEVA